LLPIFSSPGVKRRLVLLGAPGSGKGTQAEMITRQFGIPVTSPGAILRREKDLGTPLGQETAEVLQLGGLVSDKIIVGLIEDWLRLHGGHGFVFDGFPRTLPQAESLMSILTRLRTALDLAIWLEVSEQTVRDRITSRLQCGECGFTTSVKSAKFAERPVCPYCDGPLVRRNDDDLRVLQTRLQEFHTKTQPLASFYGKMSILHRIDGNRDRETVFSDISRLIEGKAPA
jgi:adenylate kinase